jgi:carboxymethylenebutenolidase
MKTRLSILSIAMCTMSAITLAQAPHAGHLVNTLVNGAPTLRSALPSVQDAKALLEKTDMCRDWVAVPVGKEIVLAFVVYPMRADKAPVVLVTAPREGTSAWVRAVGDQLAAEGFIAIAPDLLTNMGPNRGDSESFATPEAVADALRRMGPAEIARRMNAVREYAKELPAANGTIATMELDSRASNMKVSTGGQSMSMPLAPEHWPHVVDYLNRGTGNVYVADESMSMPMGDQTGMHSGVLMAAAQNKARSGSGSAGPVTSYSEKQPHLPASYYTALSTLAKSKLRKEWVDIPYGDVKLHTWVEYPAGEGKVGVVIVMQFGTGMDEWVRAVADQIAQEGFIAVAPDAWSGTGPNGGARDSFQFVDDAMKAGAKITEDETQRRYKAARAWALKLPRANGKTGSIGFCAGGGNSFRFAGEVPELNAAVVYYGTPPKPEVMAQIKAPVLGFYGENDARVTSTVAPTITAMEKLGKVYETHIYPKTTHSFLYFQEMAGNPAATNDAWPRTIAFFKKYLN